MNATDAFEITKKNWAENESKYLAPLSGFQQRVEQAALEGRFSCMVASVPPNHVDFTCAFFEQQGYFVSLHNAPVPNEVLVVINWKQQPLGSRFYIEALEFKKSLE